MPIGSTAKAKPAKEDEDEMSPGQKGDRPVGSIIDPCRYLIDAVIAATTNIPMGAESIRQNVEPNKFNKAADKSVSSHGSSFASALGLTG